MLGGVLNAQKMGPIPIIRVNRGCIYGVIYNSEPILLNFIKDVFMFRPNLRVFKAI